MPPPSSPGAMADPMNSGAMANAIDVTCLG